MNSVVRSALKAGQITNSLRISSHRSISVSQAVKKHAAEEVKHNPDEPIKFMGSRAQTFKSKFNRVGNIDPNETPWFQPFVVVGSVAIFLIYFCILREENDIDLHLSKSLFEQVPGLEAPTLITLYKYNLDNNIDNTDVIKRMLELNMDPMKIE